MKILKRILDFIMDVLETVTFVGSLFIVIYLFVFQPHQVKGHSMDNTFQNGDYILTSKVSYRFDSPARGDIVVFSSPNNPDIDFIKRIIGISGDTIQITGGKVFVNGKVLKEDYVNSYTKAFDGGFVQDGVEITVPPNNIFVMGDNRERSSDSREFGFISVDKIVGRVFFRYYPPQSIGPVENPNEK